MYSSLQFCGNVEEYFVNHAEKLLVYIVMPRLKNKYNLIRRYSKGKLVEEKKVWSSENLFLYYFSWFLFHWYVLFRYFKPHEKFTIIAGHPISFFGLSIQRTLWNTRHLYWIGDYFPGHSLVIKTFERLKKHYHDNVPFTAYLSDGINNVFNGKVVDTKRRKTIMWGVKPKRLKRTTPNRSFSVLFVGLVKESQGIEFLFDFLKDHKEYSLNIIGVCDNNLYKKYQLLIRKNKLSSRVFFPNKFYTDEELNILSQKCHVGIALYNADASNPTYYTDPGKVKAYAEMGLPVIMSDVSGIAPFVKRFHSGIAISRDTKELEKALENIQSNYSYYVSGLEKFNKHFYFEDYYKEKFSFLESI